jgi:hypothetical protein
MDGAASSRTPNSHILANQPGVHAWRVWTYQKMPRSHRITGEAIIFINVSL